MVDNRWAMTNVVRPCLSARNPSWISASLSLSRLEVASSRIRMRGSARIARAMATRWRCPPDSLMPRSPTIVSYPSGKPRTNSSQWAMRLTASISARVA